MKKELLFLLFLLTMLQINGQTEKRITILHTNDLHSRLMGYAPESAYSPLIMNNDSTVGGFARIAGIIEDEKANAPGSVLVVDAGDFMMGTLFQSLESKTGFQLRLMKKMGYDVISLGNHEYDFGPDWLAGVISTSEKRGEIPSILSGNAYFDQVSTKDDALESLFKADILKRNIVLTRNGIKIGIFSVLGKEAAGFSPKAVPVTFAKQLSFSKKMVRELKNEKCDIIICLSHSGLNRTENGEWQGEDVEIAQKVKGISLIIGGHSHTRLDAPLIVNGIPIVQTGEFGQHVGRLSLILSEGKLRVDNYKLIPVDDKIRADETINKLIDAEKEMISSELDPLGISYQQPVVETDFTIKGNDVEGLSESNLGPLVADAIYYYVNKMNSKGTDISMVAAGMLFDRIIPGIQTAPDIFRVMPLGSGRDDIPGYPLSRLYFTGKELKSILEILQVAYKSSPDNFCYFSGIRVEYTPENGLLKKIKKIDIIHNDGRVINVDFSKKNKTLYSVTASSYMLEFIGIIKKMSFGLIDVVPKDYKGNRVKDLKSAVIDMDENKDQLQEGKEWLALIEYFRSMSDTNGNGIPDIDKKYSQAVKCFIQVAAH